MIRPWVRKISWRRKWQLSPVFLPGKVYGQRSLENYSPWGRKRVGHDLVTNKNNTCYYLVFKSSLSLKFFKSCPWNSRIYWYILRTFCILTCFPLLLFLNIIIWVILCSHELIHHICQRSWLHDLSNRLLIKCISVVLELSISFKNIYKNVNIVCASLRPVIETCTLPVAILKMIRLFY